MTVQSTIENDIATVCLNRPDALNAFNRQQRTDLLGAVKSLNNNAAIRVVVLTGAGRAFSAGADLAEQLPPDETVEQRLNEQYKPILTAIAESEKIWIAAVNGVAAGIGAALAMACDLVVMDNKASFYQAFSAVGLIPDGGLSLQLQRALGKKRAFEVIALGERLNSDTCVQAGLANRVSAEGEVLPEALQLAGQLLERAPLSLRYTKEVLRLVEQQTLSDAISTEARLQLITSGSDDHQEGRSAFREKRKPLWSGC